MASPIAKSDKSKPETFEHLCTSSVKGYAFNLADIGSLISTEEIRDKIIVQLEETIKQLEDGSSKKIKHIYIGKSFYYSERIYSSEDGIYSRWKRHSEKYYGRDGMVILGEFTRNAVSQISDKLSGKKNHEHFALAIEQMLLHHYVLFCPDERVVNRTFTSGATTRKKKRKLKSDCPEQPVSSSQSSDSETPENCRKFVVYMTFTYHSTDDELGKPKYLVSFNVIVKQLYLKLCSSHTAQASSLVIGAKRRSGGKCICTGFLLGNFSMNHSIWLFRAHWFTIQISCRYSISQDM